MGSVTMTGLNMPIDFQDDEQKKFVRDAIKAGIDAWLEQKFAQVGKWTIRGLCAGALGLIAHWLTSYGWHK
jgi:hypothetical protein